MKTIKRGSRVTFPSGLKVTVTDVTSSKFGNMFWFNIDGETRWAYVSELA